mmetsp:Transcript_22314/g.45262  ORF Transcript_22314/g.45262 Transcript_22314/m.45262 type:complete len:161 (-) Transcript_22314:657-1139(-)
MTTEESSKCGIRGCIVSFFLWSCLVSKFLLLLRLSYFSLRHTDFLPVSRSLKLVRVLRSDSFRSEQLTQWRIDLNLSRHERVKFSRRTWVFHQFCLDNLLNLLPSVCNTVDLLSDLGRNDHHPILITHDSIPWPDSDTAYTDDAVAFPRLHSGRSLPGSG